MLLARFTDNSAPPWRHRYPFWRHFRGPLQSLPNLSMVCFTRCVPVTFHLLPAQCRKGGLPRVTAVRAFRSTQEALAPARGDIVLIHYHLIGLIRPTRRLIPISLLQLIRNVFASFMLSTPLPATGSGLSLLLLLDMSSSSTPGNLLNALVQFSSSTALAFAPFQ